MFRLAVTGGKGGTGKTVVAVNLASALDAAGFKVGVADADVDGPCTAQLFKARFKGGLEVRAFKPLVDHEACKACGSCAKACQEHALAFVEGRPPILFEELCSGCRACQIACPHGAIKESYRVMGYLHEAEAGRVKLMIGELKPGEARSPVVARALMKWALKKAKDEGLDVLVIDTSPGVHNAVAQALWDAQLAIAVTEPTPLGVHDLGIILDLLAYLGVEAWVVVNKADVPGGVREKVYEECERRGVEKVFEVPYDHELFKAYSVGEPLVKTPLDTPAKQALLRLASEVARRL